MGDGRVTCRACISYQVIQDALTYSVHCFILLSSVKIYFFPFFFFEKYHKHCKENRKCRLGQPPILCFKRQCPPVRKTRPAWHNQNIEYQQRKEIRTEKKEPGIAVRRSLSSTALVGLNQQFDRFINLPFPHPIPIH